MRRVKRMPADAVLLFMDETILRLLPPLRCAWALAGTQAEVRVTGQNAKRVLFGALNPRTGHRIVMARRAMRQADFQAFLTELRRRYRVRPLWLVLDRASCHVAAKSRTLAARLGVTLLWLPKQCPELNPVELLWRGLKNTLAANRQFATADELAEQAAQWVIDLTPQQAQRTSGVVSKNFWLPT